MKCFISKTTNNEVAKMTTIPFTLLQLGDNAETAYREACEEAGKGDNGTISTTKGFKMFNVTAKELKADLFKLIQEKKKKAAKTKNNLILKDEIKDLIIAKNRIEAKWSETLAEALILLGRVKKYGPAGCIEINSRYKSRTFLFFGWATICYHEIINHNQGDNK